MFSGSLLSLGCTSSLLRVLYVRFHSGCNTVGLVNSGHTFRHPLDVRDDHHASTLVGTVYFLAGILFLRHFHLIFDFLERPLRIATVSKSPDYFFLLLKFHFSHIYDELLLNKKSPIRKSATPRHPLKNQRSSRQAQCHPGVDKRNRCF